LFINTYSNLYKIKETKAINIQNNIDCTDVDKGTYIMVTNNGNAIKKIVKNKKK
jgi:hypothetical protein